MLNKKIIICLIVALTLFLAACSKKPVADEYPPEKEVGQGQPAINHASDVTKEEEIEEGDQPIDLAEIQPNEAGEIMVLMYHHIKEPEAEWSRTPENFRKDLEVLYEKGFRPISLTDYVRGNITTKAGFTPVVLTFDDGNQNNFNMLQEEDGQWRIDPDSAVGILTEFHERHPDFPLEATFFINGGVPFGQPEWVDYKLNYLVENGMDIGNHTNTHVNFTSADQGVIESEIGSLIELVNTYLPDYQVNTLALPFGSKPRNQELFQHIVKSRWQGRDYENIAILEVGWDPYHSPYHQGFDPQRIRRVRASETKVDGVGMYDWLRAFEEGRRIRFISDGNPEIVTVPEKYADLLDGAIEGRSLKTYSLE